MDPLLDRPFWIFDMDGTLTVPQHDFSAFKLAHGLDPDLDVLAGIDALAPELRPAVHRAVRDWEDEIAGRAQPMDDAARLLDALASRGARLGILTRNSLRGASLTLAAAGLAGYFPEPSAIVGRDCAPPKPSPAGIERVLGGWGAPAGSAVMVGDWVFDVQAGRAAGTATVLVARHGPVPDGWRPFADRVVDTLDALLGG